MVGDGPDRHGSLPLFHSDEAIVIRSQFWAGCEEDVGCILYDEEKLGRRCTCSPGWPSQLSFRRHFRCATWHITGQGQEKNVFCFKTDRIC